MTCTLVLSGLALATTAPAGVTCPAGARCGTVTVTVDPSIVSYAQLTATTCHDYPKVFDLAATAPGRRAQYSRALAAIRKADFSPFTPAAWFRSGTPGYD